MHNPTTITPTVPPRVAMEILIARHGAWTALRAFVKALSGTRKRKIAVASMTDHMRRDIGLAERGEPPPALRGPWM